MPPRDDTSGLPSRLDPLIALLLLGVVAISLVDLVLDAPEHWLSPHVILEIVLITLSLATALALYRRWSVARRTLERVRGTLAERGVELDEWRSRALRLLRGLGEEIDRQLRSWRLSPVEREVALLLLKGFSHREIAALTERSERTVRQHAVAVYRKSGLGGRAELSAFFLEDLLLPRSGEDEAEPSIGEDPPSAKSERPA